MALDLISVRFNASSSRKKGKIVCSGSTSSGDASTNGESSEVNEAEEESIILKCKRDSQSSRFN